MNTKNEDGDGDDVLSAVTHGKQKGCFNLIKAEMNTTKDELGSILMDHHTVHILVHLFKEPQ